MRAARPPPPWCLTVLGISLVDPRNPLPHGRGSVTDVRVRRWLPSRDREGAVTGAGTPQNRLFGRTSDAAGRTNLIPGSRYTAVHQSYQPGFSSWLPGASGWETGVLAAEVRPHL